MRIFTCTPVAFGGGSDFFARDSGLLCRGLQSIGCDSRAIMPGAPTEEDEPDLIRTNFSNLESAEWWRKLELHGIVLYAWGHPKFRKVAKAIRMAGIPLVLNQDNGGLISPLAGFGGWIQEQSILAGAGTIRHWIPVFFLRILSGFSYGLLFVDPLRALHLKQGHVIGCVSPKAAEHYKKLCRSYGGKKLTDKVRVIPHPVQSHFNLASTPAKRRQIVCVGRWQDRIQKRPRLMQEVLQQVTREDLEVTVQIVGTVTPEIQAWHRSLQEEFRRRIQLLGKVDRFKMCALFQESRVFYSPSAYESFGIAAGESLCTGCSVVADRSASMPSFEWFTEDESGTLAAHDDVRTHAHTLMDELEAWDQGLRNAERISQTWCGRLHAERVAEQVLAALQLIA
jgi:hypothetical protein